MSSNVNSWVRTRDYIRAFSGDFLAIWGNTPFSKEVNNLAYFRALTCLFGNEPDDLDDRRKLIYWFLSNDFGIDKATDTINQKYNAIPVNSIAERVLRNICTLYSQAPNRRFEGDKEKINESYQLADIDSKFRLAHETAKLCNTCLVMPMVRDGRIEVDILPPDLFRVETDVKDYRKIIALWIPINTPDKDGNNVYSFKVWTDTEYKKIDSEGRLIGNVEPNKYGFIPAAILQFKNSRTDLYGGGLWELVLAALDDNKLCFLADNDVTYSGFSVWVATNFGEQDVSISPNKILKVSNVTQGEGAPFAPSLESVNGIGSFGAIEDMRDRRIKRALRNMALPTNIASMDSEIQSGEAKKVDRMELTEIRQRDAGAMVKFENDFYPIFAKVVTTDLGMSLPEKTVIGVDYVDEQPYITPEQEQVAKQAQFDAGILGAKDYVNTFVKNELITTNEEAIQYMIDNLALKKKLTINNELNPTVQSGNVPADVPIIDNTGQ